MASRFILIAIRCPVPLGRSAANKKVGLRPLLSIDNFSIPPNGVSWLPPRSKAVSRRSPGRGMGFRRGRPGRKSHHWTQIQRFPYFLGEFHGIERLLQKSGPFSIPSFKTTSCVCPDMNKTFRPGRSLTAASASSRPPSIRHHHVGHKQVDGTWWASHSRQTFTPVGGFENHVSALASRIFRARPRTVSSSSTSKNDFGALGRLGQASGRTRSSCPPLRATAGRKIREGRSPARFGLATDGAAALLDDPLDGGQPEARPFTGLFRREERLEDVGSAVRVHADAGVAAPPWSRSAPAQGSWLAASLRECHVGRFNGQRAAVRAWRPGRSGQGS